MPLGAVLSASPPVGGWVPAVAAYWVIDETVITGTTYDCSTAGELTTALASAGAGDQIRLDGGTTWGAITLSGSGNASNWKTLRAIPDTGRPLVQVVTGDCIQSTGLNYWQVGELELECTGTSMDTYGSGYAQYYGHHVRLVDLVIHGGQQTGIKGYQASNTQVYGCRIYDCCFFDQFQGSGISFYEYDTTISGSANDINRGGTLYANIVEGNIIYGCYNQVANPYNDTNKVYTDANGIIMDDFHWTQNTGTAYDLRTLVCNNICYDNGGRGINVYLSDDCHTYFNTCYGNQQHADFTHPDRYPGRTNNWVDYQGAWPDNARSQTDDMYGGEYHSYGGASNADSNAFVNNIGWAILNPDPDTDSDIPCTRFAYNSNLTHDNNAYHSAGNYAPSAENVWGTNPILGANWTTVPGLEDPANQDFRPSSGGNLDGTADPIAAVTVDIYGATRHATAPTPGAIETTV